MFKLKDEEAGIFMTWSRLLVSSFLSVGLIEPPCVSFIRSRIDDWDNLCSLKIQIYYSLSCEHIDSSEQIGGTDYNRCDRTEVHTDNRSGFDEIACEYMKIFLTIGTLKICANINQFPRMNHYEKSDQGGLPITWEKAWIQGMNQGFVQVITFFCYV